MFLPLREEASLAMDAEELSREDDEDGAEPFWRMIERMSDWVSRGDWAAPYIAKTLPEFEEAAKY